MRRNHLLLGVLPLVCGTLLLAIAAAKSRDRDVLQSFYVARFYFSDYLPGWSNTILDVVPDGSDVRVRLIRISGANDSCPGLLVRAVGHVFRHTTVRAVAGRDLCVFSSDQVHAALKTAAPKFAGDPSDSATESMVAKCGNTEKEFNFPYPAEVDQKALGRDNPAVSRLWDTSYRISKRAFGERFSFDTPRPELQKQMRQLGDQLVPELTSGKYQTAYSDSKCDGEGCNNYLAWWLRDYRENPEPYDPAVVTLLDDPSLHLIKYSAPVFPAIAKTAHVYGDVTIQIFADPQTGTVTSAEYVAGPKLLSRAAMEAAKSWQVDPGSLKGQAVEATLRFELKCR
jgi:hypothetical protein